MMSCPPQFISDAPREPKEVMREKRARTQDTKAQQYIEAQYITPHLPSETQSSCRVEVRKE